MLDIDKMKKLLEIENYCESYSLEFLRDSGLAEYTTYTNYIYTSRYGDYLGNDAVDDSSDLLDRVLEDQNYDEFLEEYINYYVDEDDLENYHNDGLTNREIADILLKEAD